MRHGYKIAMVLIFANMAVSTGAAFAGDNLKGTYAVAGTSTCLSAPSGFANDSKGNPTIANGTDSAWYSGYFQARLTFNGDGTGTTSGTWGNMPPPPPAKAAVSAGTFSYSFTHTPLVNNSFTTNPTPGTYKATTNYGPVAGRQVSIDASYHRVFQLSNDQKYGTVATTTPEPEHLSWSEGSETKTLVRICYIAGNLVRLD
ncbi:hypothetical protein Q2941_50980 [Bradyrhizobium sp. UFLA05-153]